MEHDQPPQHTRAKTMAPGSDEYANMPQHTRARSFQQDQPTPKSGRPSFVSPGGVPKEKDKELKQEVLEDVRSNRRATEMQDKTSWVAVQTRTFTRWCNHYLIERMIKIESLKDDLHDGVVLCNLLELISGKKLPAWSPAAKLRTTFQKLENLNVGLKFIAKEGLKLVNIGPEDIQRGNIKCILGLIWTLILRYQIQAGQFGDDSVSPKQQLLDWVNRQIKTYVPNHTVPVLNFTTSWADGTAVSCLADSLQPGLLNVANLGDPLKDTKLAMQRSEEAFSIPQLVDAEDVVAAADEHSVMTYVALFREYVEAEQKRQQDRFTSAANSYADGVGVTKGFANRNLPFVIHSMTKKNKPTATADDRAGDHFSAAVFAPDGRELPCALIDNKDGTYACEYRTNIVGAHKVEVWYDKDGSKPVKVGQSPYNCIVKEGADPRKSYAQGPGLTDAAEGKAAHFKVWAVDRHGMPVAGETINVAITPPGVAPVFGHAGDGKSDDPSTGLFKPSVVDNGDGTYDVSYTPNEGGEYEVSVAIVDAPVRDMPAHLRVRKGISGNHTFADGVGVGQLAADPGARAFRDRDLPFTIFARDADDQPVTAGGEHFIVSVLGPHGQQLPVYVKDNNDGTYVGSWRASAVGEHAVSVKLAEHDDMALAQQQGGPLSYGQPHPAAPPTPVAAPEPMFSPGGGGGSSQVVKICPSCGCRVSSTKFCTECGTLLDKVKPVRNPSASISSHASPTRPTQTQAPQVPNAAIIFRAGMKGSEIKGSPYAVTVRDPAVAQNSWAEGKGLTKASDDRPAEFTIFARDGNDLPVPGDRTVAVMIKEAHSRHPDDGKSVFPATIADRGDGSYAVTYQPTQQGQFTVTATINGQSIRDMPAELTVSRGVDPNNTVAHGRGLNQGFINRPLLFTIHAKDADDEYLSEGGDTFDVSVVGPEGEVPCNVKDNQDGTYQCSYVPTSVGDHRIDVKTKGDSIKDMPCVAKVVKPGNGASSYAKGKGFRYAYDNQEAKFKVYVRDEDNKPVVGEEINVVLVDATQPSTPASPAQDKAASPSRSNAKGPSRAAPKRPDPHAKPDILADVTDNNDGTYTVKYTPTVAGKYTLSVLLGDASHPLNQSPIKDTPKLVTVYWSCPNAPCRATTDSLHEEIHKLRKLLAQETAAREELQRKLGIAPEPVVATVDGDDSSANYMDEQMELKQSEVRKKHKQGSKQAPASPPQQQQQQQQASNGQEERPEAVTRQNSGSRKANKSGRR